MVRFEVSHDAQNLIAKGNEGIYRAKNDHPVSSMELWRLFSIQLFKSNMSYIATLHVSFPKHIFSATGWLILLAEGEHSNYWKEVPGWGFKQGVF